MSKKSSDSIFWGIVITLLGIIFLAKNLGWADNIDIWEFLGTYWPLILVYIGSKNIIIYFKRKR